MTVVRSLLAASLLGLAASSAAAMPLQFASGDQRVMLLELYTSQGCSSCPPAERWMSQLTTAEDLWQRIVPVAFHVDYWDYLSWTDPFGNAENTARQEAYRRTGFVSMVYTPGFVLGGHEWRGWRSDQHLPTSTTPAGNLVATVDGKQLTARYDAQAMNLGAKPLTLHMAVLGFGLTTNVARGENGGKALTEDFVALDLKQSKARDGQWQLSLPDSKRLPGNRHGIALWVTEDGKLEPLQATGGWW